MSREFIFCTDGALAHNNPHYICRSEDQKAIDHLRQQRNIYITGACQTGKTSLLLRLKKQIENEDWYCCFIDLSTLKDFKREQWYYSVCNKIAETFEIDRIATDVHNQLDFTRFLNYEVGLWQKDKSVRLALLFDEVEALLGMNFSDTFLMTLRELCQVQEHPRKLVFALSGTTRGPFIKDNKISPFNIAETIYLGDLKESESKTLTLNLKKLGLRVDEDVHTRIYFWADGHPYLTQRICKIIETNVLTNSNHIESLSVDLVDKIVNSDILSVSKLDENIEYVRKLIHKSKGYAMNLWFKILSGQDCTACSLGASDLFELGVIKDDPNGRLKIRNRIYKRAFEKDGLIGEERFSYKSQEHSVSCFVSYSHKDEDFRIELGKHLRALERSGLVKLWYDRKIIAGSDWNDVINKKLTSSDIILVLISADFIDSEYCYDVEMKHMLELHNLGKALMIPIILRPTTLEGTPLADLQALPRDANPISMWQNRDAAFVNVTEGIRQAILDFLARND